MKKAPILVVDDDADDIDLVDETVKVLNIDREIIYFKTGKQIKEYLKVATAAPFLILCDVNLPSQDGFAIRKETADDNETKYKSVPFIFWSTSASDRQIQEAYNLSVHGFFLKPADFRELCETFRSIIDYWEKSKHPKSIA